MKKLILCLLILAGTAPFLTAQCFESGWSHPQIQGNTLRAVQAFGNVAYVSGDNGTVLKTTDSGVTWTPVNINTPYFLLGLHFTDANTGYIATRVGVYKTTNGGLSWQFTQLTTSSWMYDVEFINDSIGVICGQNGRIYRTTDAGASWALEFSWPNHNLYALHFVDAQTIYCVGGQNSTSIGGNVIKSTDGGLNWTTFTPLNQKINDVYFTTPQKGVAVTDFGRVVSTTDGGTNWSINQLSNSQLLGVQFASPDSGIAVGVGLPWITTDGGQTWTQRAIPSLGNTFWALSTPNRGQHIVVGAGGQIITGADLYATGQLRTVGENVNTIYDITFKDDLNGMACGNSATVMYTTDGGGSWQQDSNFTPGQNYHALEQIDQQVAFLAGTGGRIYKTTNWGTSWQQLTTGVGNQFYDMQFINPDTGWVVGSNGICLRTVNGGTTWTTFSTGVTNNLNSLNFRPSGVGWAVGDNGIVRVSTDFGATWNADFVGNSSTKKAVTFYDDNIGYIGGSTSTIYYTHDGGNTWLGGSITNGSGVASIIALSAGEAIGVGGFGDQYHTVDTGKTWTQLPPVTYNLMYKAYARDTNLWFTGNNGTILKTGVIPGPLMVQQALEICSGDSVILNGNWINSAGTYRDTLFGQCDTIQETTVQVRQPVQSTIQAMLCPGDSLFAGGSYQTTAGTYQDTLRTIWGCDSVRTLIVQVLPPAASTFSDTLCDGESLSFFTQTLTVSGTYRDSSLNSSMGCDSIISLDLTVHPTFMQPVAGAICPGDSFLFGGQQLGAAGTYQDTLLTINGCDSVLSLTLSLQPTFQQPLSALICPGDSFAFGGQMIGAAGTYLDTLATVNGCDSILELQLTLGNAYTFVDSVTICETDSFQVGGSYVSTPGWYTDSLLSMTGCDSLYQTWLTVESQPQAGMDTSVVQCDTLPPLNLFDFLSGSPTRSGVWTDLNNSGQLTDSLFAVSAADTGAYRFEYSVAGTFCPTAQTTVTITVIGCDEIEGRDREVAGIRVYPNPARDFLVLETQPGTTLPDQVLVWNAWGQLILDLPVTTSRKDISTVTWPAGMYTLAVRTGGITQHLKVIIQ